MTSPSPSTADRPCPEHAGPGLQVLSHWEAFVPWLLTHCAKWPKRVRHCLTQRVENHALDVLDQLIIARYEPRRRAATLHQLNLKLERMRFLFRAAHSGRFMPHRGFEIAMRNIDETGRMIYGWRNTLRNQRSR